MFHKLIILTSVLFLSACGTANNYRVSPALSGPAYYKIKTPIQCVPHARKVSGIPIRGNAHTWWTQAAGKYQRSNRPKVGAVMVLSKTQRLRYGHVAVVKRIIDSRNIEVEHANWGGDRATRAIVYKRMPVKDVSANNDWSRSRFWHYPSKTYGSVYPVSGFIYPNKDAHAAVISSQPMPTSVLNTPIPTVKPRARVLMPSKSAQSIITPIPPLKPIY